MPNRNSTPNQANSSHRRPNRFSLPCLRQLYQYLGEYDALVELTELAARTFIDAAKDSGDIAAFIQERSKQHGIKVHTREFDDFSAHLVRSYIVTVYQAAERFLHHFRKSHIQITGREWKGDSQNTPPLQVTLQNVAQSVPEAEAAIGTDLITRFDYYRRIRNWVCHDKGDEDRLNAEKFFDCIIDYQTEHRDLEIYKAPNLPASLTFDDFVLFTRITKLIAEKLNALTTPSVEDLKAKLEWEQFKPLLHNPLRMENAIIGKLKTDYGLDHETAAAISRDIVGVH